MIVPELHQIQEKYGYLPREELEALSKRIREPLHRLHEVITFFPHFRLAPPPAADIKVCRDMACHLGGAVGCHSVLADVASEFGVAVRHTGSQLQGPNASLTPGIGAQGARQPRVEIGGVSCLGRCDGAPAVLVELHCAAKPDEFRVLTSQTGRDYADRLRAILGAHLIGGEVPADPVDQSPLSWQIDPYHSPSQLEPAQSPPESGVEPPKHQPYAAVHHFAMALQQAQSDEARKVVGNQLVEKLRVSDLRGMGGAGRPAYTKWDEVREQRDRADVTYVICNGDESEPSTFKDREILLRAPHLVIEGMVLGALLVGARQGYVYIRHEYYDQAHSVAKAIAEARKQSVIGPNVLGTGQPFELEVFESPGGYVCGEQSALIEAIEEHRAEPRNRPPVIEANGLYDKPTLLNNVETFAWVPAIVINGAEWYRDRGLVETPWYIRRRDPKDQDKPERWPRGKGMRLFSICGDVNRPGVFDVPTGLTLGELIELAGGVKDGLPLLAFAPSGPSGGFLPAVLRPTDLPPKRRRSFPPGCQEIDIRELPLDKAEFDNLGLLLGAGLLIVADAPGREMLDLALNATRFFRNESCGKCVPCRLGTEKLVRIGERIAVKPPPGPDERGQLMALIGELQSVMEQTSICNLGTSASKPLASLLEHEWPGSSSFAPNSDRRQSFGANS
jgi:formate dehydrogenase beta subunit